MSNNTACVDRTKVLYGVHITNLENIQRTDNLFCHKFQVYIFLLFCTDCLAIAIIGYFQNTLVALRLLKYVCGYKSTILGPVLFTAVDGLEPDPNLSVLIEVFSMESYC